ncbi:hypothetical protein [Streptomyces longisporoflavus]|uniref:Uncharacterized protein n=1 Tax=Streptomyces longisporoflavus TaxID=28044 RepID=A0ABW7R4R3_9ACTN
MGATDDCFAICLAVETGYDEDARAPPLRSRSRHATLPKVTDG